MNHTYEPDDSGNEDPYGYDAGCDCGQHAPGEAHHHDPATMPPPAETHETVWQAPAEQIDVPAPAPERTALQSPPPAPSWGDQTAANDQPTGYGQEVAYGGASGGELIGDPDATQAFSPMSAETAEGDASKPGRRSVSRRRFIQGLAAAGTLGYGVVRGTRPVDKSQIESQLASQTAATPGAVEPGEARVLSPNVDAVLDDFSVLSEDAALTAAPVDQRVLVLIEFQGGNDGPSTVVPYGVSAYYDQRPRLAIAAEDVIPIDDQVGWNPSFGRLSQRQLAAFEGVGPVEGVLSHFEMVERWERGDMLGAGGQRAGFLARLADAVDIGGAVTGLSVAGHTPRFDGVVASTIALSNLNQLRVLTNDDWIYPRYRSAIRSFGGGPMASTMVNSWNKLFDVGDSLGGDIEEPDRESVMIREGGGLGRQLAMAAELVTANVGVRVIHAAMGGFDTHDGHQGRHANLMGQFDAAVDGFMQQIADAGMADRVLVATTSEFGRRVRENGSGLDHGAASSMIMAGPIRPGRHGEMSPLTDLDGRDNLKTTVPFDRYLATISQEWLGVEAGSVLPGTPEPLTLF